MLSVGAVLSGVGATLASKGRRQSFETMGVCRALTFGEEDAALNSLVVVEFKKPDRSDYRKEDPIDQVYRLIREIKGGHFKDKTGREIKVAVRSNPGLCLCYL